MGRFVRFILEYVGNLDAPHHEDLEPRAASVDRRTNRHGRELMDWTKGQMEARGLPAAKKHELVHDLRRALRPGGLTSGGESANDATAEGEPEWVSDEKGLSRDAPS